MPTDLRALRVALLQRGMTQLDLARKLQVPPTTLSGWLRSAHPAPADLDDRIAEVLANEDAVEGTGPA